MSTIGIVGGGRVGELALRLFLDNPNLEVVFVSDPDAGAPGMKQAKERGVTTLADPHAFLVNTPPEFVMEVTGVATMAEALGEVCAGRSILIPSAVGRLLLECVRLQADRIHQDVAGLVTQVDADLARGREGSENMLARVGSVMGRLNMLSLNAGIESAKAGVHGKGFAVIAEHMARVADEVRQVTQAQEVINKDSLVIAQQMSGILARLR